MLRGVRTTLGHPARLIPLAFFLTISLGAALLMTPWARVDTSEPISLVTAVFTSCSATCVTGLTVVDTATYWSRFGQVVILALIQVGGFGIMTLATLLAVLVSGHVGLRSSLVAKAESRALSLGDIKGVVKTIAVTTLTAEVLMAFVLAARFHATYDYPPFSAIWHGVFHSISAFNNAGFALYSDSLAGFAGDMTVLAPIMVLIVAGGIGFPVFHEIRVHWRRPGSWSVHTKMTMIGYFLLLVSGAVGVALFEWHNPGTLGSMSVGEKLLNALFGGVTPRTAGFNTFDYALATPETWAMTDVLMFIGGGSAGTAGGIKVGTFIVLAAVLWSEVRGEREVIAARRAIPAATQRQAITVALLSVAVVAIATMTLLLLTDFSLDRILFQSLSAFGTVGLGNGVTERLPSSGKVVVIGLMFVGRVGTVTAASAFALRQRRRAYRFPEESPIIG
jgi:potassium uptake TrkH family protein